MGIDKIAKNLLAERICWSCYRFSYDTGYGPLCSERETPDDETGNLPEYKTCEEWRQAPYPNMWRRG